MEVNDAVVPLVTIEKIIAAAAPTVSSESGAKRNRTSRRSPTSDNLCRWPSPTRYAHFDVRTLMAQLSELLRQ
jgi:hypothetical protein